MNKVILIGRLTADPEGRYTASGTLVVNFTVAVNRTKDETDFIPVSLWGKSADFALQYIAKGDLVCVEGRLDINRVEEKTYVRVQSYNVQLLNSSTKKQKTEVLEPADLFDEDDIPF